MEQQTQQAAPPAETQQPQAQKAPAPDRSFMLLEHAIDESVRRQAEGFVLETCRFSQNQRIADMMYRAGLYEDLKNLTPEQGVGRAMVKIELGRTMGIEPFEAMNGIYFVYGRPSLESGIRAAKMKRNGYDWRFLQHDEKGCRMLLMKEGRYITKPKLDESGNLQWKDGELVEEPVVVSFVEADAERAGLLKKNGSLYKVWPQIMYFNRCISIAQKTYAPEVLNGADLVSREEAQDMPPLPADMQMPTIAPAPAEGTFEAAMEKAAVKLATMTQPENEDEPVISEKPKQEKPAPVSVNPTPLFQGGIGKR